MGQPGEEEHEHDKGGGLLDYHENAQLLSNPLFSLGAVIGVLNLRGIVADELTGLTRIAPRTRAVKAAIRIRHSRTYTVTLMAAAPFM